MKLERRASFGWPSNPAPTATIRNGLVAHYDGSNQGLAGKPHSACRAYWRRTHDFHVRTRGLLTIGYSFGVCPHGIVMEGRGLNRIQAAQPGGNSTWYSCTFMSGPNEKPTAAQLQAWRELRAWLRGKGVAAAVRPHSDFVSTSCPGPILRAMVRDGTLRRAPSSPPAKPAPKPTAPPFPGRLLRNKTPMMHGADVLAWQRQMRKRGWAITTDSYYGDQAEQVCSAFQREKKLGVDGIVGPKTWAAAWSAPVT